MICHCSAIGETAGHDCCVPVLTEQTHANNISSLVWLKALISFKEEDEEEEEEKRRRKKKKKKKKKKNECRQPMKQKAWVTKTKPWHC